MIRDHGDRILQPHDPDDAFAYAEEARAFEPLDLLLDSPGVPAAFRQLTQEGETLSRASVQEHLPRGTFLIEFCVLDDRTFVWIVSHDGFEFLTESVARSAIENWARLLRESANSRNARKFEGNLGGYQR